MITKREKLQYVYVFLTDIAALAASVILAWLIVGGIMGQLLPYSVLDWVQALVLLVLAYTVTFFCFDQTENIVKRTRGQEAKLSIKSNLLMMVIYSAFLTLSKAVLQDSRYFLVGVVSFNLFLLPAAHGLLKKLLVKAPDSLQNETLVGIVTTGDHAGKMIREISNDWSRRVCGVALLEATGDAIGTKVENIEIKANYDTFMNWLRRAALDEVYIDVPMDSGESFIPYLEEMESMGLTVHFRLLLLDRIAAPVALVVCVTLIFTVLLSQLIGVLLPVIAEKFKIDPAVMASPLITTIVDTTTLLIYFNVAKMVLHI